MGGAPRWGPALAPASPGASPLAPLADPTTPPAPASAPPGDGYVQADARGPRDYEDHLYVNTQGLDAPEPLQPEDSPKKDLFDMRMWGQASLRGRVHTCHLWSDGGSPASSSGDFPSC